MRSYSFKNGDPGAGPILGTLVLANVAAWLWAYVVFADRLAVMATALLAWVLGLRHAVDADHIAAIDNVVRKLMQAGDRPKYAGLYFALGHSTVVVVATLVLSVTAISLLGPHSPVRAMGSLIAVSVSATFLLLIAVLNLVTFIDLIRTLRPAAPGGQQARSRDTVPAGGGILARLFGAAFRMVTASWHMFPLGLLFGLGFDTATEVGVISISTAEAARGFSLWGILVFPVLFAAGMALVDTADSLLMVSAYRWALVEPRRRLWYNITITGASVAVALFVGSVEVLGLLAERLRPSGALWSTLANLNERLTSLGLVVIALFAVVWLVSLGLYYAVPNRDHPLDRHDAGGPEGAGRAPHPTTVDGV